MVTHSRRARHRLERDRAPSIRNWREPQGPHGESLAEDAIVQTGWGRLLFGHTFRSLEKLAVELRQEKEGQRDIALYLRDPHVVLSIAPQELFLDPSHTYRLWVDRYRTSERRPKGFFIRRVLNRQDVVAMNRLYAARKMVPVDVDFVVRRRHSRSLTHLVAEDARSGEIIGTVTGVDHVHAFSDPERGSSLWCLAVDPQAGLPGVGETLVRQLAEHYFARGRAFMDLSVMHDNDQAISLYEKLGFERVPVFCLKHKNPINEQLFMGPVPDADLNPYAKIIVDEARRRGIIVQVVDEESNFFSLTFGGRTIRCRESLSDLTSAVAFTICDDKRLCRRLVSDAGLEVPAQRIAGTRQQNESFLDEYGRVVVKPARGEQGAGVAVDLTSPKALGTAIARANEIDDTVLIEQYVEGHDLRIIVIDHRVVAAAIRRPAHVIGTGEHAIVQLIRKQSRRRAAATGGESKIPEDEETRRCVEDAGYTMDSMLPAGELLTVRKTANLHMGGTIHDVTPELSPALEEAAIAAARAIDIPVVGFDFIVPRVDSDQYWFIEANERPGLANHEPQPTAEKFVDLLFPQTASPHLPG
jgi:GNAT-family acetyltransferase (TIGR03103 family)